jgi:hypothetical protein
VSNDGIALEKNNADHAKQQAAASLDPALKQALQDGNRDTGAGMQLYRLLAFIGNV